MRQVIFISPVGDIWTELQHRTNDRLKIIAKIFYSNFVSRVFKSVFGGACARLFR